MYRFILSLFIKGILDSLTQILHSFDLLGKIVVNKAYPQTVLEVSHKWCTAETLDIVNEKYIIFTTLDEYSEIVAASKNTFKSSVSFL